MASFSPSRSQSEMSRLFPGHRSLHRHFCNIVEKFISEPISSSQLPRGGTPTGSKNEARLPDRRGYLIF
uniref:Uncharacterized protein n=2 Tax=Anguilla anguilla TaxID=7936 RepID=A0A0E9RR27_ANGAN